MSLITKMLARLRGEQADLPSPLVPEAEIMVPKITVMPYMGDAHSEDVQRKADELAEYHRKRDKRLAEEHEYARMAAEVERKKAHNAKRADQRARASANRKERLRLWYEQYRALPWRAVNPTIEILEHEKRVEQEIRSVYCETEEKAQAKAVEWNKTMTDFGMKAEVYVQGKLNGKWYRRRPVWVAHIKSVKWVSMHATWNEEELREWIADQHHFVGAQWHVTSTNVYDSGHAPVEYMSTENKLEGKELEQQERYEAWLKHGLTSGGSVREYTNGTGGNGWVYAFTMPSEARVARLDGKLPRVKIGMASGCYKQRIRDQVTAATMESPSILLAIRCGDPRALERQLHDALKSKDRHAYGGAGNEWFYTIPTEILELAGNCRFIG